MRSLHRVASLPLLAAAALIARAAVAVEIPNVGGEPMSIDVTNTAIVGYHFDNRNDDIRYAARYLDDDYGDWVDRFNVQLSWWRLQLGVRIDAATYFATPTEADPELIAKIQSGEVLFGSDSVRRELNTRYLNTYYPAKLWLSYVQPGLEATVGDYYVQLGRGLVFSVRKLDELAIDTTVRGGKLVADHDFGPLRLGATAFAGQMNPVRVDDASGRRLHGDGSPLFFGFPDRDSVDDLEGIEAFTDAEGNTVSVTEKSRPSYLEDTVFGGRVEGGNDDVQLAVNGAMLLRKSYTGDFNDCYYERAADQQQAPGTLVRGLCANEFPEFARINASRLHDTIRTFSGSVNLPSIADHGDLYVEVAGQQLRDGHVDRNGKAEEDLSGYAVYAAASVRGGPVSVSLEGKHYRRFFPLSANVDVDPITGVGFGAPEFDAVAYNQVPTAEAIYTEPIGAPNVCVSGGRGRVDYRFHRSAAVYAWVGRYASFSELTENNQCDTGDAMRTDTWDTAAGTDLVFERGKSHAKVWGGARQTDAAVPFHGGEGEIFYSEGYIRYDLVKHLTGAFSLQMQGNHRRRYRPENFARSWFEGENYSALQWSPHVSAIFGYEYTSQEGCEPGETEGLCHYFNGGLQWKSGSSDTVLEQVFDTVQVFVGQRRGGIRCVSGACRFFPPFEGARLELVSRF
ncbi:MAG: hypothetical protein IT372_08410 [Polyangiaceae bacterium]|nr:hypothetical protein [Polyangiaceae bacterium]